VCKNHLFRRTLPVRDSHGQWSICNDRSLNPVSTSPAKTQNRDNEDRTYINQSLRFRNLDQDVPICHLRKSESQSLFESQSISESQFSSPPHVCPASPPGGEPQRPLPARRALFPYQTPPYSSPCMSVLSGVVPRGMSPVYRQSIGRACGGSLR
jgi:hypothetical protein